MNEETVTKADKSEVAKPGYRTSEFWLTATATVVGLALASGAVPETGVWQKVVSLVVSVLATLGYTVSRAIVKKG